MPYAILALLAFAWGTALTYGQFTPGWGELVDPVRTIWGVMMTVALVSSVVGTAATIGWRHSLRLRVPFALGLMGLLSILWGAIWVLGALPAFYSPGGPATDQQATGHMIMWYVCLVTGIALVGMAVNYHRDIRRGEEWTFRRLGEKFFPKAPTPEEERSQQLD